MDTHEIAWAAGFFDGEGCFGIAVTPSGRQTASVSIAQVDRDVLDRFILAVGTGKIYGPYVRSHHNPAWASIHQYSANGLEKTQAILALLWRYLGKVKREQGAEVLRALAEQGPDSRSWASKGWVCRNGHDMLDLANRTTASDGRTRCKPCRRARERENCRKRYRLAHGIPVDAPVRTGRPRAS